MYISSNFPSVYCLGHQYLFCKYLVILSFALFTLQDSIFESLNINLVVVPSFIVVVGAGLVFLLPPPLTVEKAEVLLLYNLDKRIISARMLASLVSILVYFIFLPCYCTSQYHSK